MEKFKIVNGKTYEIRKLLGHGKGGYSYLALYEDKYVVFKQIHHEPCDYYNFGNKIEAEYNDYKRLVDAKINISLLLDINFENEVIIKEYIEGETIFEMLKNNKHVDKYIPKVRKMAKLAMEANLNIDYFPTNFVVCDDELYYIDYECNNYMEEWNFENWGIKYWSRTPEFIEYIKNYDEK